jgi:multiple sugar transport system ATP-binding protein
MAELKLKNISKSFGTQQVIEDMTFEVSKGEFCILLGPSGCGKSTVLRLIAGLEQQDRGEIYIGETEVSGLIPKKRDIAMVFQSYALYPHMTVYENIAFPLKVRKLPKPQIEKKVKEVAALLDIQDLLRRKPAALSGGQRQRVALGRAIVRNPMIFLFDEPLSNLDAKLRSAMRIEIAKLHQRLKTTMIYVTHDQVEAMTLGEKIILLDKGKIQQVGTPREIYDKPANLFAATFIGSPQMNLLEGKVRSGHGGLFFEAAGIRISLAGREEAGELEGKDVSIGIRPESFHWKTGPFRGELEFVEHVGAESFSYFRIPGLEMRFAARAGGDFQGRPGDEVNLNVKPEEIHIFSGGQRV